MQMNSHTGIAIRFLFAHGTRAKAKNDQRPFQSSLHMGFKGTLSRSNTTREPVAPVRTAC